MSLWSAQGVPPMTLRHAMSGSTVISRRCGFSSADEENESMTDPKRCHVIRFVFSVLTLIGIMACTSSPTGRPQLQFFPEEEMAEMGTAAYQEIKQQTPVSQDASVNRYVQCVARAITQVVAPEVNWE